MILIETLPNPKGPDVRASRSMNEITSHIGYTECPKNDRNVYSGSRAFGGEIPLNPPLQKGGWGDLPGNHRDRLKSNRIIVTCYITIEKGRGV